MPLAINKRKQTIIGSVGFASVAAISAVAFVQASATKPANAVSAETMQSTQLTATDSQTITIAAKRYFGEVRKEVMTAMDLSMSQAIQNDPQLASIATEPWFKAMVAKERGQLNVTMAQAEATFLKELRTVKTRDQAIDLFNRTKADVFNRLEVIKNDVAATMSNHGHLANVVKDRYMNMFNMYKDRMGNRMEEWKNMMVDWYSNHRM